MEHDHHPNSQLRPVESRMRWKSHVRFGGRTGETHLPKDSQGAPVRSNWTDGGPTNTSNLGALCRYCHRAHHAGKFSIVGNADNPDGLIFRRPDGTIIESAAKPTSPDGPLPPSAKPFVHPTGERWLNRDTWFTPDPATQPPVTPRGYIEPREKTWLHLQTPTERAEWEHEHCVSNETYPHDGTYSQAIDIDALEHAERWRPTG